MRVRSAERGGDRAQARALSRIDGTLSLHCSLRKSVSSPLQSLISDLEQS